MMRNVAWWLASVGFAALAGVSGASAAESVTPAAVVSLVGKECSFAERLAAREIRRYYYVRTGRLLPILESLDIPAEGALVVVGAKTRPIAEPLLADAALKAQVNGLGTDQYLIRVISYRGRPVVLVAGGDPAGTL